MTTGTTISVPRHAIQCAGGLSCLILETAGLDTAGSGKNALEKRLLSAPCVQFCYEIAGPHDIVALFDCESMSAFNDAADELLTSSPTVRRYETHFVKREVKFAPFVELSEAS